MISVPNRLRPLSGNKNILTWILAIVLIVAFAACDGSKRTTKTEPVKNPTPAVNEPDPLPNGEVEVVDVPKGDTVDIDSTAADLEAGPDYRYGATISVMAPFLSDRYYETAASLPDNSDWAVGYYAGVRLGLEKLEADGHKATVHIFDTKADPGTAQRLFTDPELLSSHAIIGPYLTKPARAAAVGAQTVNIPIVIPYSASTSIVESYDRLLQFNPGLLGHFDAMAAYLDDAYDPEQVVLVGLPTGEQDQQIRYLQYKHKQLNPGAESYRTWKLSTSDVGMQGLDWADKFDDERETIFVFPVYKNPKQVLGFLSQLQIGREGRPATVFGMPQWAEISQLDPGILEDLGVRITSSFYVDLDDAETNQFIRDYTDRYGAYPELQAFLGYDAIQYVVPLANKYGRRWVNHLPNSFNGLVSDYRLQPVYDANAGAEQASPQRYENRDVRVLTYRNFSFREE